MKTSHQFLYKTVQNFNTSLGGHSGTSMLVHYLTVLAMPGQTERRLGRQVGVGGCC